MGFHVSLKDGRLWQIESEIKLVPKPKPPRCQPYALRNLNPKLNAH